MAYLRFATKSVELGVLPRRLTRLYAAFCLIVFSIFAPPASGEGFDVDYLTCGDFACAYVYQGEGVSHPQLVVQVWASGVAQFATTVYTFIYDYPDSGSPTITVYIDGHLAHRTGASPVQMTQQDVLDFFRDGLTLAEGLELAFNSPGTYHLGMWPNVGQISQIIEESAEAAPQSIVQWDLDNLDIPGDDNNPDQPGVPPSASSDLFICEPTVTISGDVIDCDTPQEPQNPNIGPGSTDLIVCDMYEDIHGIQTVNCGSSTPKSSAQLNLRAKPVVCYQGIDGNSKRNLLVCDKTYDKPLPKTTRTQYIAKTDCRLSRGQSNCPSFRELEIIERQRPILQGMIARDVNIARASHQLRFSDPGADAGEGPILQGLIDRNLLGPEALSFLQSQRAFEETQACSPQDLLGYSSIASCSRRCEECDNLWLLVNSSQAAAHCTLILGFGGTTFGAATSSAATISAILVETTKRLATTYSGVVIAGMGLCTATYVAARSAFRLARLNGCKTWCENCLVGGNASCVY